MYILIKNIKRYFASGTWVAEMLLQWWIICCLSHILHLVLHWNLPCFVHQVTALLVFTISCVSSQSWVLTSFLPSHLQIEHCNLKMFKNTLTCSIFQVPAADLLLMLWEVRKRFLCSTVACSLLANKPFVAPLWR